MRAILSLFIAGLISTVYASMLYPRAVPGYPGLYLSRRTQHPFLKLTSLRSLRSGLLGQCYVCQMSTRRSSLPVPGHTIRQLDVHMFRK